MATLAQFPPKLASPVVSAKSFGAVGDGVADDTIPLQAALSFGLTYLPAGTYKITTSLQFTTNNSGFVGAGNYPNGGTGSTIKWGGSTSDTMIENSGTTVRYGTFFENVGFDGNATDGLIGLDITYCAEGTRVEHCRFDMYGNNTRGIYAVGTLAGSSPYYQQLIQNDIAMNNVGGVTSGSVGIYFDRLAVANSHYQGPNTNFIHGGRITGGDKGIWIRAGGGNVISQVDMESISSGGNCIELGDSTADFTSTVASYSNATVTTTVTGPVTWAANQWLNGSIKIGSSQYQHVIGSGAATAANGAVSCLTNWSTNPAASDAVSLWFASVAQTDIVNCRCESSGSTWLKINPGVTATKVNGGDIGSITTLVSQSVGDPGDRINPNAWRDYSPIIFQITFGSTTPADATSPMLVNGTAGIRSIFIPGAWQVLAMAIRLDANISAGSMTFQATDNDGGRGSTCILSSSNTFNVFGGSSAQFAFPPGAIASNGRGRFLGLNVTTSGVTTSSTATAQVLLFVQLKG